MQNDMKRMIFIRKGEGLGETLIERIRRTQRRERKMRARYR